MDKQDITDAIKARFASVRERGKVLAQALKVRADIAVVRRRLRMTFAELGESVYGKMATGQAKGWGDAPGLAEFKARIEGLKAELDQREKELTEIMEEGEKKAAEVKAEVKQDRDAKEDAKETAKEAASSKAGK